MPKRTRCHIPNWLIFIGAILFIVLIYIVYTASLGQVYITPNSPKGESSADRRRKAEEEHQRLMREISNQEELKAKLRRKFRWIYLFVRIVFAALLAAYNFILYHKYHIHDLGSLLNCNEVVLIGFILVNFVCYGSLSNFNKFVRYVKNYIENWVYRNNRGLDNKLKKNIADADRIKKQILDSSNYS